MLTPEKEILFVCEANLICSPLAAAIARHLFADKGAITFNSAGIFAGNSTRFYDRRILKVATERGVPFEKSTLTQLTTELLQKCETAFYLNEECFYHLREMNKDAGVELHMLSEFCSELRNQSVLDPIVADVSFEEVFETIYPMVESLESKLFPSD